jgi:hypothetical protein
MFRQRPDVFGQPWELPGIHLQSGISTERLLGLLEWMFSRATPNQCGQTGRVAIDQAQRLIHRKASGLVIRVMVVVPDDRNGSEKRMDSPLLVGHQSFAWLRGITRYAQSR